MNTSQRLSQRQAQLHGLQHLQRPLAQQLFQRGRAKIVKHQCQAIVVLHHFQKCNHAGAGSALSERAFVAKLRQQFQRGVLVGDTFQNHRPAIALPRGAGYGAVAPAMHHIDRTVTRECLHTLYPLTGGKNRSTKSLEYSTTLITVSKAGVPPA